MAACLLVRAWNKHAVLMSSSSMSLVVVPSPSFPGLLLLYKGLNLQMFKLRDPSDVQGGKGGDDV